MWAYARQNVKHDSRKKHMVDGNDVIHPWNIFRGVQIEVDEWSKNLDFDCIKKALSVSNAITEIEMLFRKPLTLICITSVFISMSSLEIFQFLAAIA